jgi:hypothetical protein
MINTQSNGNRDSAYSKNNFFNAGNSSNLDSNQPYYHSDPNNQNTKTTKFHYSGYDSDQKGTNSANPGIPINSGMYKEIENNVNNNTGKKKTNNINNYINNSYESNNYNNSSYKKKMNNSSKKDINIFDSIKPEVYNYNQKLTEKECEKMMQDYRARLNGELLKILTEEKYREEEREILYNNIIDIIEKKRFEKIISMERAQSSERILKINE